jgi:hypothetical protein
MEDTHDGENDHADELEADRNPSATFMVDKVPSGLMVGEAGSGSKRGV